VNRIIGEKKYQGLVLAPDQALALITPVQRALSHGIATVIVGSPWAFHLAASSLTSSTTMKKVASSQQSALLCCFMARDR